MSSIKEDGGHASEWISRALQSSGYRADFSPQSLREIDRFFDEHSANGAAKSGGLLSKDLGSRIFAVGAYIGEVVRRNVGGEWMGDDNDPEVEINIKLHLSNGMSCWPVQRAMKRFKNGEEDGIMAWGIALGLQMDAHPDQPKGFFKRLFG
jgi:hypothetical protein